MPGCARHDIDGSVGPCLPTFRVGAGVHVNARSEGEVISFTRAAVTQLTVDEFALLTGHEVAHYYLRHRDSTHANELAADRLGAELACKAGYNPAAGVTLFRHLASGKSHPRPSERTAAVLAVICTGRAASG